MKYPPGDRYKIVNPSKRRAVRFLDTCLGLAPFVFKRAFDCNDPIASDREKIRRILCIRVAFIGDVVMTLPVLNPLRQAFPNARIDFVTSGFAAPLLESNPDISEIITFDAPWFYRGSRSSTHRIVREIADRRYDLGIDFRGDVRNIFHLLWRPGVPRRLSYGSGGGSRLLTHVVPWTELRHKIDYHLDLLRESGIPADYSVPRVVIQDAERQRVRGWFPSSASSPILIHPGSRLESKRWPSDRFAELANRLSSQGLGPIVVLGGPEDADSIRKIRQAAPSVTTVDASISIREMAALCETARCMVCHDSAPMHIAAAVGCHVVALFGPSCPEETAPAGEGHIVLEGSCPAKDHCDEVTCRLEPVHACIQSITVDDVLDSCRRILTQLSPPENVLILKAKSQVLRNE